MNYICYINGAVERKYLKRSQHLKWAYFGNDINKIEIISDLLGKENKFELNNLFHEIANGLKQPYLNYIASIGKANNNSLSWWASGLASKSPYLSQLFKLLCYSKLIEGLTQEHNNLIFFVDDPWFFLFLKKQIVLEDITFIGKVSLEIIKLCCHAIIQRLKIILDLLRKKRWALSAQRYDLSSSQIMLYSWVLENSFTQNNKYVDYTLGELGSYLASKGLPFTRITFSAPSRKNIKKYNQSFENIIMYLNHVSWFEIILAGLKIFRFKIAKKNVFDGTDITLLLKRETFQENVTGEFVGRLLFSQAIKKILSYLKNLRKVVYPFEGQPWERMFLLAIKKVRPDVVVIGYQHSSFAPFDLNYSLGELESGFCPLPDLLLSSSGANKRRLIENGFPENRVKNIGTLRYSYLFRSRSDRKAKIMRNSVLICLPYDSKLALMMLEAMIPGLLKLRKEGIVSQIRLRAHPLVPVDPGRVRGGKEFKLVMENDAGTINDSLSAADILIYCNGTVGIEGEMMGKKIVKYLPELDIDLDPLSDYERDNCFSDSDFEHLLRKVIQNGHFEKPDKQVSIKNFLEETDYSAIDKVLL